MKRALAVIIACVMLIFCFAACGSNEPGSQSTNNPENTSTTPASNAGDSTEDGVLRVDVGDQQAGKGEVFAGA